MKEASIKAILHQHQLRITQGRCDVIHRFLNSSYALSARDLEETLPQYDRVTLYRTLHSFIEKGILHLIPHEGGLAYFGLSEPVRQQMSGEEPAASQDYHPDHIHFTCTVCGRTECLPDHTVPEVSLPRGYQVEAVDLLVKGHCQSCQD